MDRGYRIVVGDERPAGLATRARNCGDFVELGDAIAGLGDRGQGNQLLSPDLGSGWLVRAEGLRRSDEIPLQIEVEFGTKICTRFDRYPQARRFGFAIRLGKQAQADELLFFSIGIG